MSVEQSDADTADAVLQRIENQDIETVRLQFTDILGTIKNVSIPAHQVEKALTEGIWFDGSSINGFARVQESDMRLDPDPSTFTRLPWQNGGKTARMIADVVDNNGEPFAGDPRNVLKQVLEQAADHGFELNVGPEPEFFVFETDDGEPTTRPHDSGGYFDIGPRDLAHGLRREIIQALEQMDFEVEASHHEVADGQHEIAFKYADALTTADNCATLRWVVRTIAAQRDLHATFMPKPIEGVNGSGMHTHLSLFSDGENAFHDPADDQGLSDTAYRFLAGIIEHAPAITAICNPTVNSYKRLVPGYEAPVYTAWSDVNRSALVRKPAAHTPESTRLELRSPDPSCNPYLAFAAILAAGLDGIANDLDAPDPVKENIYEMSDSERDARNIDMLPGNLQEAVDALEQDAVIRDALGAELCDKLITAKRQEWDEYRSQVTSWEHETYLRTH